MTSNRTKTAVKPTPKGHVYEIKYGKIAITDVMRIEEMNFSPMTLENY
jgi:hypothetical protein